MLKSLLNIIFFYFCIIICFYLLGVVPLNLSTVIPIQILFLFPWIIAPIGSAVIAFKSTKYSKLKRAKPYILIVFSLNLLFILITALNYKPHSDVLGFSSILFNSRLRLVVLGPGHIVGIIFTALYREKSTQRIHN